ncbi:MAG: Hsp20/alpha crystallin family protein [Anaerolineae bacterium]|nr:Hsp20/alpha crystallin family protein [Anaerolineae bacterium]
MSDEISPENQPDDAEKSPESGTHTHAATRRWVVVRHTTVWAPPTDIYEKDSRLIVVVEIAGMRNSDFSVTLQGQRLIISGTRQRVTTDDCAYHQLEIRFGEFRTEVNLPWSVTRDAVKAIYRDGFLRVELPQAHRQKIQVVNIENAKTSDEHSTEQHSTTED